MINQDLKLAAQLRTRILALAREAGRDGITANETEQGIPEHKSHSITPRFAELIKSGTLVRVRTGTGKPTTRFPAGRPLYATRFDTETKREVVIHWLPEFAPYGKKRPASVEQPTLIFEERYGS